MLEVLFGKEEKERRRTEKRRSEGMQSRMDYLKECEAKSNDKLEQLRKLKEDNPKSTLQNLADIMGVSTSTIKRLNRKLKD